MKRRILLTFFSILFIAVSALLTFLIVNKDFFFNEKTTLTSVSETSTSAYSFSSTSQAAATSKAAKKKTSSEEKKTTENTTFIDIDSLSIIDLYPLSLSGGDWDVKHCQGIAVDKRGGFIYYSYTTMLVKCSFEGKIVATVKGIMTHMGDITFNEADEKLYCGYNPKGKGGCYVLIFDTKKITKMNMKPTKDIVRSVYIKEAHEDYLAKVTFRDKDENETVYKSRYGCLGIDGTTMGPDLSGKIKDRQLLTVAYGIRAEKGRKDNDYQVLLQYDVGDWWESYGREISDTKHRSGPEKCKKYFLYTGNTNYGVQTMEYFDELNLWMLNCYKTKKTNFNPYTLFVIDGDIRPVKKNLKGQPKKDKQNVLSLYTDGSYDKKHDIWGWYTEFGSQGISYMGDGLFYIVRPYETWMGKKVAISYLNVWKSNKKGNDPFVLSVNIPNDYKIKKAKHIETTTAAKPKETMSQSSDPDGTNVIDQIIGKIMG